MQSTYHCPKHRSYKTTKGFILGWLTWDRHTVFGLNRDCGWSISRTRSDIKHHFHSTFNQFKSILILPPNLAGRTLTRRDSNLTPNHCERFPLWEAWVKTRLCCKKWVVLNTTSYEERLYSQHDNAYDNNANARVTSHKQRVKRTPVCRANIFQLAPRTRNHGLLLHLPTVSPLPPPRTNKKQQKH